MADSLFARAGRRFQGLLWRHGLGGRLGTKMRRRREDEGEMYEGRLEHAREMVEEGHHPAFANGAVVCRGCGEPIWPWAPTNDEYSDVVRAPRGRRHDGMLWGVRDSVIAAYATCGDCLD